MCHSGFRRLSLLIAASAAIGCASSSGSSAASGSTAASNAVRHDRTNISPEELRDIQASNLYEVVQRLHPEWLQLRNGGTLGSGPGKTTPGNDVQVYMDTQHAGSTDILRQFPVNSALSLRYYSASEAQARFGSGNLNGAIQVITAARR